MKKTFANKTAVMSVATDAVETVVAGQVLESKSLSAYEQGGVIYEHRQVHLPVGKIQQQQMYVGTNGLWVNVGDPRQQSDAPLDFGYELPLNANVAIQYVYLGA